jgi:hypothetical protein
VTANDPLPPPSFDLRLKALLAASEPHTLAEEKAYEFPDLSAPRAETFHIELPLRPLAPPTATVDEVDPPAAHKAGAGPPSVGGDNESKLKAKYAALAKSVVKRKQAQAHAHAHTSAASSVGSKPARRREHGRGGGGAGAAKPRNPPGPVQRLESEAHMLQGDGWKVAGEQRLHPMPEDKEAMRWVLAAIRRKCLR